MLRTISLLCIIIIIGLLSVTSTHAATSCTNCGLRAFLADLQKEYDNMSSMSMKLSSSIAIMNSTTNSTLLAKQIQTRQAQLTKIQAAQQSLYLEMSVISAKCDKFGGDDCDVIPLVQDSATLVRRYMDGSFASSCFAYLYPTLPYVYKSEGSGLYQIKVGTSNFTVYCDMDTMGGGWTLAMKTSTSSAYVYSNAVWTNTDVQTSKNITSLSLDEDYVSPAFYKLKGTESMLAMSSLQYFNTWNHTLDTARNLANGAVPTTTQALPTVSTCAAQTNCGSQPINKKPLGIWQALSYNYAAITYYRFGYPNYVSVSPSGWGAVTRVGFSADGNGDDTGDSQIGIGIDCTGTCSLSCGTPAHGKGSGYYFYKDWNLQASSTNGALRGWLWIR